MGTILVFDPARRRTDRKDPSTGPAQLLFFTGIRYERHADAAAPEIRPARGPRGNGRTGRRRRA
ncbi:hypothetical protein [Prosthecomicrobium sp. N25]|uniref:hypothetical protein n=1 Tax=Prosthecomicrobium sp. N25 TaxID=3129254 RepID=UPI003078A60D